MIDYKCKGTNCKYKAQCLRYTTISSGCDQNYVINPMDDDGNCVLFYSTNQENILNQLKDICND